MGSEVWFSYFFNMIKKNSARPILAIVCLFYFTTFFKFSFCRKFFVCEKAFFWIFFTVINIKKEYILQEPLIYKKLRAQHLMLDVHLWKWNNSEFEIYVTPLIYNFFSHFFLILPRLTFFMSQVNLSNSWKKKKIVNAF